MAILICFLSIPRPFEKPPICVYARLWPEGLRFLSRRATDKKRGRDGTKYYSKFHHSNYLTHPLASISLAAVYTDAVHIEEGVDGLKQRALALAPCDSE